MTINEAIEHVDMLKPNQYEYNTKVKWLSKIDGMIFTELFATHEGCPVETFEGYEFANPEEPLLVGYPYDDDIYTLYLQMQIDKENGEMNKYNQSASMFNNAYKGYCDWYNRTHMPLPARTQFIF